MPATGLASTTGGTATGASSSTSRLTTTTATGIPDILPPTAIATGSGSLPPPPPPATGTGSRIDSGSATGDVDVIPTGTGGNGDCAFSTYGCCPGEDVAKEDALGSNCRSRPGTNCRFSHFGCCPYVDEDRVDSAGTNCATPPPSPNAGTASSPPPPPPSGATSGTAAPPSPPPVAPDRTLDTGESNISSSDDGSVPIWPFIVIPIAVLLVGVILWYGTAQWLKKQEAAEKKGKMADV